MMWISSNKEGSFCGSSHTKEAQAARTDVVSVLILMAVVNVIAYQITWVYAGPITALVTVIFITLTQRKRGNNWSGLGLVRPARPWVLLWQPLVVLTGTGIAFYLSSLAADIYFEIPVTKASRFGEMENNLPLYLWWVSLGWIFGGFFEEMIFRGYLLSRIERVFRNGGVLVTGIAVLAQAAVFGLVHFYYQGAHGALTLFAGSTVIGACYILFNRNLWPLILAHGILNTLGFLGEFLGDNAI